MTPPSSDSPRNGDKPDSSCFEEAPVRLPEARDRAGPAQAIPEIDAHMGEPCLMMPHLYPATPVSEGHFTRILPIDHPAHATGVEMSLMAPEAEASH